jgi:HK97 family phage major capsid protein
MDLKTLREKRAKALAECRALTDKAEKEGRVALSAEEQQQYDRHWTEHQELSAAIAREEELREQERRIAAADPGRPPESQPGEAKPQERKHPRATEEYRAAFRRYLVSGRGGIGAEELRALQADADAEGGFIVAPQQFVQELLKAVDDALWIRRVARIESLLRSDSLGVPSLDADPADADWTTELAAGNEDSAMAFGKRELRPHPLAKRIKVSRKLLRIGSFGPEALVRERLAYKFGVTLEKAYLTGSGAGRPLGLFTASADGIPTSRDVSTGNTTTSITFDGLHEVKYTLKGQYLSRAQWLFHRDALKQIAKLKDGDGQYLWRESVRAGEPSLILGLPFMSSEFAPNTFTTGQYVGLLGDFRFYWIADALSMEVQRLEELYAENNQVGFIGRYEGDGMPVLAEAFVRVKLA